jgi:hypothetical protein
MFFLLTFFSIDKGIPSGSKSDNVGRVEGRMAERFLDTSNNRTCLTSDLWKIAIQISRGRLQSTEAQT